MTEIANKLRTIIAIPVTPFDDRGDIDLDSYKGLIKVLIEGGITAITPNGNTSEFYSLSQDEGRRGVQACMEAASDRAVVMPGIGHDIASAVKMARSAERMGAEVVMVHQPVHPFRSTVGWIAYHEAIADAVPNLALVPYIRDSSISALMIGELANKCSNVVAVKYAIPDPLRFAAAVDGVEQDRLVWICGLAESWAPFFWIVGARGFTSGLVNVAQSQSLRMLHNLEEGNYQAAMDVWREIKPFEELRARHDNANNVSVVKEALCQMGLCSRSVRPPITDLVDRERDEVRMILSTQILVEDKN